MTFYKKLSKAHHEDNIKLFTNCFAWKASSLTHIWNNFKQNSSPWNQITKSAKLHKSQCQSYTTISYLLS